MRHPSQESVLLGTETWPADGKVMQPVLNMVPKSCCRASKQTAAWIQADPDLEDAILKKQLQGQGLPASMLQSGCWHVLYHSLPASVICSKPLCQTCVCTFYHAVTMLTTCVAIVMWYCKLSTDGTPCIDMVLTIHLTS